MKTIDKHNPYGYRIGYRENGSRFFEDYFLTYTYPDAVKMRQHYLTYPPIYSHDDGHLLINPFWEIRPTLYSRYTQESGDKILFDFLIYFSLS